MARQRSHSIEFKRQVAQEFIAGESTSRCVRSFEIYHQTAPATVSEKKLTWCALTALA